MNRLMISRLLYRIVTLYKDNTLTETSCLLEIGNLEYEAYDEEKQAYVQTKFIYFLFANFPYYQILDHLNGMTEIVLKAAKKSYHYYALVKLFKGCLEDILPTIKRRIQTEVMLHLLDYMRINTLENQLTETDIVKNIEKNLCDPIILTSMDIADNYFYSQSTLPGIKIDQKSLREQISKANTGRKMKATDALQNWTNRSYNEQSLEAFMSKFYKILGSIPLPYKESCIKLMSSALDDLYTHSVIEWSKNKEKEKDTYQLNLPF